MLQPWNNLFLIVIVVWMQTGYAMVLFSAAIKAVPTDIIEAASRRRRRRVQDFFSIIIPSIMGTIVTTSATVIIFTLKIFDVVLVMTGGQFGTDVIATQFYNQYFVNRNAGLGSAIAIVLLLTVIPVMAFTIFASSTRGRPCDGQVVAGNSFPRVRQCHAGRHMPAAADPNVGSIRSPSPARDHVVGLVDRAAAPRLGDHRTALARPVHRPQQRHDFRRVRPALSRSSVGGAESPRQQARRLDRNKRRHHPGSGKAVERGMPPTTLQNYHDVLAAHDHLATPAGGTQGRGHVRRLHQLDGRHLPRRGWPDPDGRLRRLRLRLMRFPGRKLVFARWWRFWWWPRRSPWCRCSPTTSI